MNEAEGFWTGNCLGKWGECSYSISRVRCSNSFVVLSLVDIRPATHRLIRLENETFLVFQWARGRNERGEARLYRGESRKLFPLLHFILSFGTKLPKTNRLPSFSVKKRKRNKLMSSINIILRYWLVGARDTDDPDFHLDQENTTPCSFLPFSPFLLRLSLAFFLTPFNEKEMDVFIKLRETFREKLDGKSYR